MIEIYAMKMYEKIDDANYQRLLLCVSEEKQSRIKRFVNREDALRTLLADILIRVIIHNKINVSNEAINFVKNKYGKPFLKDISNFYFNLSYSGKWIVCAIDDKPIGVDIENIRHVDFDIAKQFFSEEECIDLFTKKGLDRLRYFYDLWTLKESFIKALGEGISIPLNSFTIKINENSILTIKTGLQKNNYWFRQYDIDNNYKLSVCGLQNSFPESINIVDISTLMKFSI